MSVHLFILIGVVVQLLSLGVGIIVLVVFLGGVIPRERAALAEARAVAAERETDGLV